MEGGSSGDRSKFDEGVRFLRVIYLGDGGSQICICLLLVFWFPVIWGLDALTSRLILSGSLS